MSGGGVRVVLGDPWLWGALALGVALRVWGLGYGLPHVYNPDEVSIMSRALALANNGLNPGNFLYPSFFFYVLAAAVGLTASVQVAAGTTASLTAFEAAFWADPTAVYLTGRSVSVGAGALTIVTTYLLGSRVGGMWTARTAALLYAVAYIPVRDAHFIKHDVPTTLLVTLVALAAHRLWRRGEMRDAALSGAAAGLACATHYYAIFATAFVAVALWLRALEERPNRAFVSRIGDLLRDARTWLALAVCVTTFAALSPYVLVDWRTAWRDIAANRAILVDRTRATFGLFGALDEHIRILVGQGTGIVFFAGALLGAARLVGSRPREAAWLLVFPLVFVTFLANSWPFGRTGNVLYPFLAVTCAYACVEGLARRHLALLAVAVIACAWSPTRSAVTMDRLMTRADTRTIARDWLAANVPDGAGIAVEPYSVPLTPSRDWLADTLVSTRGSVERAGYRSRTLLGRNPYPMPAYRVLYIGEGGLDEDKRYVSATDLSSGSARARLREQGLQYVLIKRFTRAEPNALRDAVAASATLVHTVSPFASSSGEQAQLPDYDIAPTNEVVRPGPVIEVWSLR